MEKFSKADLVGGIDVSVELGQNKPRTQVGRRAVAEQAIRLGLANPFDPYERIRLLELIGIPELMEDFKVDQQRAAEENDQFLAMMGPVQPPLPWDNHDAHIISHRRFTYSDAYRMLPPPVQMAVIEHMNFHWMILAENAKMPRKTGSVAPGGENKGTATGGGGSGGGSVEEELLEVEAQGASPDTGGSAPGG
jgi:hypothetical protein